MITEKTPVLDDRYIMWDRDVVIKVLGLGSVSTLYRAMQKYELPRPIRIGGSVKWRKSEVLAWLDSRPQGLEHEV